jgi:hypothetical protein
MTRSSRSVRLSLAPSTVPTEIQGGIGLAPVAPSEPTIDKGEDRAKVCSPIITRERKSPAVRGFSSSGGGI